MQVFCVIIFFLIQIEKIYLALICALLLEWNSRNLNQWLFEGCPYAKIIFSSSLKNTCKIHQVLDDVFNSLNKLKTITDSKSEHISTWQNV